MNKEKKLLSHIRQKEHKRLRGNKTLLDSFHYPKDDIYRRVTEWSCINCESFFIENGKLLCESKDDYQPVPFIMACDHYSFCGKDRLNHPYKIVDSD